MTATPRFPYYPHSPLPAHLEHWERLDCDPRTADLVDEPWRYFEPFLAARGYTLCWRYYSRDEPETPVRTRAFHYPVARDAFRPRSKEGFVHYLDVDANGRDATEDEEDAHRRCGIHQTTGWLTTAASLKMAYDSQDRVCALKALHNTRSRTEIDILTLLTSSRLRGAPDNHTIPVLDIIVTQDWTFVAMPYWPRGVQTCIPWEVDDYFNRLGQALEGLYFMHRHGIIHRDISVNNILLNVHAVARGVYTPVARRGVALAYIDFGCAARFAPDTNPATWTGSGHWGTIDHVAPEVLRPGVYALPPVDVYALGSVFKRALDWETLHCTTFGNPGGLPTAAHAVLGAHARGYAALLARMTDADPARRPDARTALAECRALQAALAPDVRFAPPRGYPVLRAREQREREQEGGKARAGSASGADSP